MPSDPTLPLRKSQPTPARQAASRPRPVRPGEARLPSEARLMVSVPRVHRRTVGTRLREAVQDLARDHAEIRSHSETPWASATFSGGRHRLECVFSGPQAIAVGEGFIDALPDHEFALPGQIVVEAQVVAVDHRLSPDACLTVTIELLLLEEC